MSAAEPHVHPRPQLARDSWVDLSGTWRYAVDPDDAGLDDGWVSRADPYGSTIEVPYPPGSPLSGVDDVEGRDVVWYQRDVDVRPPTGGNRLLLHFQAVDHRAQVWVNGHLVASHEGGHTPFSTDITPCLRTGEPQRITVRVEDPADDLEQPRGKQGWFAGAHRIWHDRTTGIWQRVWLETVPARRIDSVRWTPDVASSSLTLDVRTVRRRGDDPLRLRVRLTIRDEVLVDDVYGVVGDRVLRTVTVPGRMTSLERRDYLWAPEHPNLIEARLDLLGPDGPIDSVTSYTALRSIGTSRRRILLNGRPYFLRLVLDHGYWPESRLAAPSREALRAEVELVKELGFNGVRVHQKVEDPEFLYWCDRLGLLVWAEMPAAYEFSERSVERTTREWLEILSRDHNHPCIVTWVGLNESWGVPAVSVSPPQRAFVRALRDLADAHDGTRLVIGNDGWENLASDLLTVHDYAEGRTLRDRYGSAESVRETVASVEPHYRVLLASGEADEELPVVISECGGKVLADPDAGGWAGYGAAESADALLSYVDAVIGSLLDSPALAGFCYTQLTDAGVESNGLVTADRRPKVDPARVRAIVRRPAAGVPGDVTSAFEWGDYPTTSS